MKICVRCHDMGRHSSEDIVKRARELGIDGVQMVVYKNYPDVPYAPGGITSEKAAQIGKALREGGVEVPLIGAYFNPVHSDKAKVERCFTVFSEYLKCAKDLGGEYVGSETGSYNDDKWTYNPKNRTDEAYDIVVDTFSRLADIAAASGVNIAMEGAAGHVCWKPEVLDAVVKRIGKPNVKIIFDLYNYMDEANQHDYLDILDRGLRIFAGNILLFHIKDCLLADDGSKPKQVGFGKGDLDKRAILGRIKAYDPDAVLMLEGTVDDDLPFAVRTIREIWESV